MIKNQNVQNIDFFGKKNAKTAKRPPGSSLKKMPDIYTPLLTIYSKKVGQIQEVPQSTENPVNTQFLAFF